ncbi:MAG TPA: aminotransferase class V-fold PLP-dependent enzyme [Acidimicrobiales bacterium]|nr:aminotransferase class V-fold PLP-dependent enzyme [Acidimicrobiales bacterium]
MDAHAHAPDHAQADGPPLTYLDHAASTPVRDEVAEAMAPFAKEVFGHPSGHHRQARASRRALEDARDLVAELLGAAPREVVFTSGGTEADNLAVLGVLGAAARRRHGEETVVVSSAIEHAAVLEACRAAADRLGGVVHERVGVDAHGVVDLDRLSEVLSADVALVTVMLANNELGTLQPLGDVVSRTRQLAPGAVVHTDAVQAAPWLDVALAAQGVDLVAISAHKLGGPKGAGALVVREGVELDALVVGGGQERERRAGTHDVAGAVGLATALAAAGREREGESVRVGALRDRLADGLLGAVPSAIEAADRKAVLPGHCHLCFAGVDREELVVLLDEAGVCVSAGAACASGALEPSHVLAAMGVPATVARGSIRFSLGHTTTPVDVERALAVVPEAVARLRG